MFIAKAIEAQYLNISIIVLALLTLSSLVSAAPQRALTWDDGLIAHLSFDEGAGLIGKDISGRGHFASLIESSGWQLGKYGNALLLDNNNSYATVRDTANAELNLPNLTVATWIMPTDVSAGGGSLASQYIFSKHRDCCDDPGEGGYGLRLIDDDGDGVGRLSAEVWLEDGSLLFVMGNTAINEDQWHHVALVFDGSRLAIFVDGVLDNDINIASPQNIGDSSKPLLIGALAFAPQLFHFQGLIDEFRVYNKALTDVAIADLNSAVANDPRLLFAESFDDQAAMEANGAYWHDKGIGGLPRYLLVNDGYFGGAIHADGSVSHQAVFYPAAGNLSLEKGAISLYLRTQWEGDSSADARTFFQLYGSEGAATSSLKMQGNFITVGGGNTFPRRMVFSATFGGGNNNANTAVIGGLEDLYPPNRVPEWDDNDWQHITLNWDTVNEEKFIVVTTNGDVAFARSSGWDPSGIVLDAMRIASDNFNHGKAYIDDFRIYSEPFFDVNDVVASYPRLVRGDAVQQNHETLDSSPDDVESLDPSVQPGEPYVFFASEPFEKVMPGNAPESADVASSLNFEASLTEGVDQWDINYETLFFNIYPRIDLGSVQVTVGDFMLDNGSGGPDELIPVSSIKTSVIHNWWQAGIHLGKGSVPNYTPELLLPNDRPEFTGFSCEINGENCAFDNLPTFASSYSGTSQLILNALESRQMALTVPITANMQLGVYRSIVTVEPQAGAGPTKNLELVLTIRDIRLLEANKDNVMSFRMQYLAPNPANEDNVTQERYLKQLDDIRAHGYNGVTVYANYDGNPIYLPQVIDAGFRGRIVHLLGPSLAQYDNLLRNLVGIYQSNNLAPVFFTGDEVDGDFRPAHVMEDFVEKTRDMPSFSAQSFASVTGSDSLSCFHSLMPLSDCDASHFDLDDSDGLTIPGIPSYALSAPPVAPLDYAVIGMGNLPSNEKLNFYHQRMGVDPAALDSPYQLLNYWQLAAEDPRQNRFRLGYWMWLTKTDGAHPYTYMHIRNNPWNDFDAWSNDDVRDDYLSYPSTNGPVATIQWEAMREGIDDYRYLRTWQQKHDLALANNGAVLAAASKAAVDASLEKFTCFFAQYDYAPEVQQEYPCARGQYNVDVVEFHNTREVIASEIISLQAAFPDADDDQVVDSLDNCPAVSNGDQLNFDGDAEGDICDTDDDNDGLLDVHETNTGVFVSDQDTGTNPLDSDSDGDGAADGDEVIAGTDPNNSLSFPAFNVPAVGLVSLLLLAVSLFIASFYRRSLTRY